VKQSPAWGCGENRHRIRQILGNMIGTFERVNCDVDRWGIRITLHRTQWFADPKHRCVVALPFTNCYAPIERHAIEHSAHRFYRGAVSGLSISLASPSRSSNRSRLSRIEEMTLQIDGRHDRCE
jgi:hypothetical protein